MKHKCSLLACVLAIVMIVTSLPLVSFAGESNNNDYYATVIQGDGSSNTISYTAVFNSAEMNIDVALFTLGGSAGAWTLTSTSLGRLIYLDNHTAGYPTGAASATINITKNGVCNTARDYNSFTLKTGSSYLYFHDNSNSTGTSAMNNGTNYCTFDRQSTANVAQTNFSLFVKDEGNTESGIYGFKRIQNASELVAGKKYLIAHPGNYSNDNPYWYVLLPSVDYNHGKFTGRIVNHSNDRSALPSGYVCPIKPNATSSVNQPFVNNVTGTSGKFRIPGIVTLDNGNLVATADARWNTTADGGGNDSLICVSEDNGTNWKHWFANYLNDNMSSNAFSATATAYCDSEIATDGETLYLLSTFFPGGKALNSTEERVKTGAALTNDLHLYLTAYSTNNTAENFVYCVGPYVDGYAHIYSVRDNRMDTIAMGSFSWNSVTYDYSQTLIDEDGYVWGGRNGTYTYLTNIFYKTSPFKVRQTTFLSLKKSTDGGKTWSAPKYLNMKNANESFYGVGPGRGVVSKNFGTIFFSCYNGGYGGFASEAQRSSIVYSNNEGKSWSRSADITDSQSSESQLVILGEDENGVTLRCFYRSPSSTILYRDAYYNAKANSIQWTGSVVNTGITKTGDCQISCYMYSQRINGEKVIFVSTPTASGSRSNGKIYSLFLNDDNTINRYEAYSVNNSTYMYSCMTELADGRIALLFENGDGSISYRNIDITDLTSYDVADESALIAALDLANSIDKNCYSADSNLLLSSTVAAYSKYIGMGYSQSKIDNATATLLNTIYSLKPILNISVLSGIDKPTISYNNNEYTTKKHSVRYGTVITATAPTNEDYVFIGWYDILNHRFVSRDSTYTFKATTNLSIIARFAYVGNATITFMNDSGWVQTTVTKSIAEWEEIEELAPILPEVPYSYGRENGRWVYDEEQILAQLRAGENVIIKAEYDEREKELPPVIKNDGDTPVLNLTYDYNDYDKIATFIMTPGFPDGISIESIGIAFYHGPGSTFDPTEYVLLQNNKNLVSTFNPKEIEDNYIVNIHKFLEYDNWCARGFVNYYDESGVLKTVYSNQINLVYCRQV